MQCTADHSGNEAEWCATQVDAEGEVINKQWGDCDTKSLSCLTLGAGSIGQSRPAPKSPKPPTPIIPKGKVQTSVLLFQQNTFYSISCINAIF